MQKRQLYDGASVPCPDKTETERESVLWSESLTHRLHIQSRTHIHTSRYQTASRSPLRPDQEPAAQNPDWYDT